MIRNLLESVEENYISAVSILIFVAIIIAMVAGVSNSLSEHSRDVEMAKLGCSQELHNSQSGIPYVLWKCPNGAK